MVQQNCDTDNNTDNNENNNETYSHIGQVFDEVHGFKHSYSLTPFKSTEEIQNYTACDNGSDLTGNVNACGLHEKEVLRIFLKSHFMYDTS